MKLIKKLAFILAVTASTNLAIAQDVFPPEESYEAPKKEYSPFVGDHFPTRPLFGDTHLHTNWSADAGYYVRVIEIPKPRWTAYDAKFFNVKMPNNVPMTVQDRAYTSPILVHALDK